MPQGAIRYQCPCGAEYLVAVQDAPDEAWVETVRGVAHSLGIEVVDGSQPSFVCLACGVTHLRAEIEGAEGTVPPS